MAKDNPRARRLGEQIQRELTDLLRRDVKDERIGNVTITAVSVTGDLRTARVYYLVFGKEGADPKVQRGLESAAGFLRGASKYQKRSGSPCQISALAASLSPNRKIGLARPSTVSSGR